MHADALAQYLIWKKWRRWFAHQGHDARRQGLCRGHQPRRRALRRQDRRGAHLRVRRRQSPHRYRPSANPDADAELTQGARDPRCGLGRRRRRGLRRLPPVPHLRAAPVVGTQGLVAVAWHRSYEQYAGTQMQNRFEKLRHRIMTERDYKAWLAVRVFGEAVTRTSKTESDAARLHPVRRVQGRGLQGPGTELSPLGSPAAPADPARRPARAGLDLAAGRISAREVSDRHARRRCAGKQMQFRN